MVSDEDFAEREERWSFDVPDTKEAYLIRRTFDGKQATRKSLVEVLTFSFPFLSFSDMFPSETAAKTAVRWIPRGDWGCSADPSGRSVKIHNAAYGTD